MTVLRSLSFTIDHGEFVAIIGPSGSGKSTLMNMLGCLDVANEGDYFLDGQEIRRLSDNKLAQIRNEKIGFIFQNFNLLPKLSAVENVELPLIYRGMSHRERREIARNALVRVGLESRMNHRPPSCPEASSSEWLLPVHLPEPPILLADEPTGALDSKTGKEVLQMIKELNEQGHTIILITHDLEIAEQAKRVIRIQDGDLVEDRKVAHS